LEISCAPLPPPRASPLYVRSIFILACTRFWSAAGLVSECRERPNVFPQRRPLYCYLSTHTLCKILEILSEYEIVKKCAFAYRHPTNHPPAALSLSQEDCACRSSPSPNIRTRLHITTDIENRELLLLLDAAFYTGTFMYMFSSILIFCLFWAQTTPCSFIGFCVWGSSYGRLARGCVEFMFLNALRSLFLWCQNPK
jgi:DNA-directed RNA polymerase subunit L